MPQKLRNGFTLAELLIALTILGEIAAFSIPKIITAQQNGKFNAIAKEDASTISAAYQTYIINNGPSTALSLNSITSYLNYIAVDTSSLIDASLNNTSLNCSGWKCYRMANGSVIAFDAGQTFGASDNLAVSYFYVDPDGVYSGTTNGNGKSIAFFIYYNGRLTTQGTATNNSHDVWGTTYHPDATVDPTWFSW